MVLTPGLRKLSLAVHLTASIGWLGAAAAFLALAIAGATSEDAQLVRAACMTMDLTVTFVIVPLAGVSLVTGLVSAVGTTWGLFRHYWVLVKLVLTAVAFIVLLVQLQPIGYMARMAADAGAPVAALRGMSLQPLIHSAGGVAVLLIVQILGVYKPRGLTRYGRRGASA